MYLRSPADTPYFVWCGWVCVRSGSPGNSQGRAKCNRRFGKIYFWAMAGVAVTALILSVALPVYFLAMVAVFSFYSAFAAYRVLYLKGMYKGARPKAVDWMGGGNGVVEPAAFPHGFFAAGADARWRGPCPESPRTGQVTETAPFCRNSCRPRCATAWKSPPQLRFHSTGMRSPWSDRRGPNPLLFLKVVSEVIDPMICLL